MKTFVALFFCVLAIPLISALPTLLWLDTDTPKRMENKPGRPDYDLCSAAAKPDEVCWTDVDHCVCRKKQAGEK